LSDKGLLVNAIDLVEVDGSTNIPTVLYYRKGKAPAIGGEALSLTQARRELNEDFKIDLGNAKPGTATDRRTFPTASGDKKSAAELTADFIHELLGRVNRWLADSDLTVAPSIIVAEPLSLLTESSMSDGSKSPSGTAKDTGLVSKDWLQNYRSNIKRILVGKGFADDKIQFLPEPFAVFQYYRHGKKHPLVADRRQHNALVVDFGGGTFDACVIETTKEGEIDINDAKRLSKPRSAASTPVGGYFINRIIAEHLLEKYLEPRHLSSKLRTGFDVYRRWRRGELGLSTLAEEHKNLVQILHALSHDLEDAKLALSRSIGDWRLDARLPLSVPVAIPSNPFTADPTIVNGQLTADDFRDSFVKRVWQQELKNIVRLAIDRGKDELNGAPITVVLLSGGSANIGWLRELLQHDFAEDLAQADFLDLKDYQEVVAKGLAVESVRRFCQPEGDFASTTYNRLCLILDPDESGLRLKQFHPKTVGLASSNIAGVLLPSSSAIGKFIDQPMKWKVRLDKQPDQTLDYYFLRSSFNPSEINSLQNVEQHTVVTPKECRKFDQQLQVELTVGQDGTASPRFIYKTGRDETETIDSLGRPFYLDMTFGKAESLPQAYIGLDFGTSNTSVSFVSRASIEIYTKRAQEKSWNDLSGLVSTLPYPLAVPLARYLRSDPGRLVSAAREFGEGALALAAYVAFLEYCSRRGTGTSRLFKNFVQSKRSAGPLWALAKASMQGLGKTAAICAPLKELTEGALFQPIDQFVNNIAQEKHDKIDAREVDTVRPVQILANILQKVFASGKFGFFQGVRKERFGTRGFRGVFRHAVGANSSFVMVSDYTGSESFSDEEPFIVQGTHALSLQPLIFWHPCPRHPDLDSGHCYFFDSAQAPGRFSYKAAGYSCTCIVAVDTDFAPLAEQLSKAMLEDPSTGLVEVGSLRDGESGRAFYA